MSLDSYTKFQRWFVEPLNVLKTMPNGDGGFVALSIGCQLCERFYRARTHTQEIEDGMLFQEAAGIDLGIGKEKFQQFWKIFRHGMQHQGSPKNASIRGIDYRWRISSNYTSIPVQVIEQSNSQTVVIIQIDPWKFADLIVSKFDKEPNVLDDAISHAFGDIYDTNDSASNTAFPATQSAAPQVKLD